MFRFDPFLKQQFSLPNESYLPLHASFEDYRPWVSNAVLFPEKLIQVHKYISGSRVSSHSLEQYRSTYLRSFLQAVRTHRDAHSTSISQKPLVGVHVFFPSLVHTHLHGSLTDYLSSLSQLFSSRTDPLVLADTPEQYTLVSSHLLERGVIDDVVFTQSNKGYLLDGEKNYSPLAAFGGYESLCFSQFLSSQQGSVSLKKEFIFDVNSENNLFFPYR